MYGRGELPGPTGTVPINPVSTTAYCTDPHDNSFSNGQIPLPPGFVPHQVPAMMAFPPGYVQRQIPTIMPVPQRPPGCPPGLEYLTQVDQLLVHQKVELIEAIFGWETNNQYVVKNNVGQQVLLAVEESDVCTRIVCCSGRSFTIHVRDNMGQEVLTLTRPLKCSSCWFPCCLQELEVQVPPGTAIGYVMQDWHPYLPKFTIRDERKRAVLRIVGPFCDCNCCSDVVFKVTSLDEALVIGRISKQWAGLDTEMFTDADHFGVQFPMDLDVKIKAVVLAACFLILPSSSWCKASV
ncbi:phospholipid scramblase 1 isoform X2 [Ictalurus punctatus]|uniref:Phospholipid scramblase n=1 Tax=Ictalurus punctatus TaxID=7998 RepID=A0A9F7TM35_ICTPU|nr:phospholipid scramblase 1 isoform X2 [Ictalurus punctatus]